MSTTLFLSELKNLAAIRDYVQMIGMEIHAAPAALEKMIQAVDEAATNIMMHGYAGESGDITIEITQDGAMLRVKMQDHAPSFDPHQAPLPDLTSPLEQRKVGGLGVYLIRSLVDRMEYQALPQGGNELTLTVRAFDGPW